MNIKTLFILLSVLSLLACDTLYPQCDCDEKWRYSASYEVGDVVEYYGICYQSILKPNKGWYPGFGSSQDLPEPWQVCY